MFKLNKKNLSTVLFLLAIFSFISALYFSFQAGCAGDLKSGIFGNPLLALEIQNKAFSIMFFSLALGVSAIAFRSSGVVHGLIYGWALIVFGSVSFWILAWQLEILGVQSCF